MKKILIFAPTAPSSGITQYLLNMLSQIPAGDARIDILSFRNHRLKKWAEDRGTTYFELDISMYKHPIQYRKLLTRVFSGGYDIVHFHLSSVSTLINFRYARKCGVDKIIVHSHNSSTDVASKLRRIVFGNVHKILRGFANRYYDVKCACSLPAAQWMFGKKEAKDALLIKNAIDTEKFGFCPKNANEIRAKYGITTDFLIGHIGRFTAQKNHSFLLDVFADLCKVRKDCTLMCIGNGELLPAIRAKVQALGLDDKVILLDFQEDIYSYYSAFDLFLMPSVFEGLPITLVEAQANGLPILVSDAVTRECDCTGLIEYYDLAAGSEKWAEKACEMLDRGGRIDTAAQMARSGFSLSAQAKLWSELYTLNHNGG